VADALKRRSPRQIIGHADTRAGSDRFIINSFAAHFAQVSVDPDTGQVRVLRYVAAHDCGQPINVMAVEGQIEGGVMQGFGYALTESLTVDPADGSPSAANLDTFKVPAQLDMPQMQVLVVDSADPVGPFGAKAVGEVPVAPVAAAIANAVYDATGVRIRDLPITPEKVLRGLRELAGK
jgi:xanthine dehydrogenase molybdenum-binding subunit